MSSSKFCGIIAAATMGVALLTSATAEAATISTSTYKFDDRLVFNEDLANDGWQNANTNWVSGAFGIRYARNENDTDQTIHRLNDSDFSYQIQEGATELVLDIDARTGTNFWETMLGVGTTQLLGVGSDFGADDKFYIKLKSGARIKESGTSAVGDVVTQVRLVVDLLANGGDGSGDLFIDSGSGLTEIISDVNMLLNTSAGITNANSLIVRAGGRFVGPGDISITTTVVPEPTTLVLLGLGGLGLMAMRRRRRQE